MGVYLPNMEMPKSCSECRFAVDGWCYAYGKPNVDALSDKGRTNWCPLVPVPPHYDLIDHNALKIAVMNCDCETRVDLLKHTMYCINKAPVVIPSDMPTYETEEGE